MSKHRTLMLLPIKIVVEPLLIIITFYKSDRCVDKCYRTIKNGKDKKWKEFHI